MHRVWLLFLALSILLVVDHSSASTYTVTELGTLGGAETIAAAVNLNGDVVGWADTASGQKHAFRWKNGVIKDLETLGGPSSFARRINQAGQIAGTSDYNNQQPVPFCHAFLWEQGTMKDLGPLNSWGYNSSANGINQIGQVVGTSDNVAFLYENNVMKKLEGQVLGGSYEAIAINDLGVVAGTMLVTSSYPFHTHPIIWKNGVIKDLKTLPEYADADGYVTDINNANQVIGHFFKSLGAGDYQRSAFLWQNDVMQDLGNLGLTKTIAYGINNAGQVVGEAMALRTANGQTYEVSLAFLWEKGVMYDLNKLIPENSGWLLTTARGINDAGQIVGDGRVDNNRNRAFLLTPTKTGQVPYLLLLD